MCNQLRQDLEGTRLSLTIEYDVPLDGDDTDHVIIAAEHLLERSLPELLDVCAAIALLHALRKVLDFVLHKLPGEAAQLKCLYLHNNDSCCRACARNSTST